VAILDYDNEGGRYFVMNGTTLEPMAGKKPPTNHLYHNNHDGTFTDVTEKAGWRTAAGAGCVRRDYDNDGKSRYFCDVLRKKCFVPQQWEWKRSRM